MRLSGQPQKANSGQGCLRVFSFFAISSIGAVAQSQGGVWCENLSWIPKGKVTFNNNVWNPTTDGAQCISVDRNGDAFNVTWQWERGDPAQPVHSFPYVRFNSEYLPGRLWDLSALSVDASWDMFPALSPEIDLGEIGTIANVAIDMFLDQTDSQSDDARVASHEVMIWFATYGGGAPFGTPTGIRHQVSVQPGQSVGFQLFDGTKADRPQRVLSWQAESPVRRFNIDVLSFLQVLANNDFLSRDLHVGLVELGTETFYASENITFTASNFGMNISSNATARERNFPSSGANGPGRGWGGGRPSHGVPAAVIQLGWVWMMTIFILLLVRYL